MNAGFNCVIATNTYVFHAKSKSYSSEQRNELVGAGDARVLELHGKKRVVRAVQSMQDHPLLQQFRAKAAELWTARRLKPISAARSTLVNGDAITVSEGKHRAPRILSRFRFPSRL
jgi:hypothetical protein